MRRIGMSLVLAGAIAGLSCTQTVVLDDLDLSQTLPYFCDVTRTQCLNYQFAAGGEACTHSASNHFVGTTCGLGTDTAAHVCGGLCAGFADCKVNGNSQVDFSLASTPGICAATNTPTSPAGQLTAITCTQSGIACTPGAFIEPNGDCAVEAQTSSSTLICFNSQTQSALKLCQNTMLGNSYIRLTSPQPNDSVCYVTAPGFALPATSLAYALTPGQSMPYSVAGMAASLQLSGGSVIVGQTCDADGEFCHPSSLALNAFFAPTTVFGQMVNSPSVSTSRPLNLTTNFQTGQSTIAAGEGLVEVAGSFNVGAAPLFFEAPNANASGPASLLFQSGTPWTVSATGSGFNLSGAISQSVVSSDGTSTPFSANLQLTGTPSASVAGCANLSPIQQLFGFELPTLWTSTASLTTVPSPVTQGCAALAFNGSGYQTINGARFSTSAVSVNSALSVDLFVPGNQPNPSWLGALQMYLTCPSGSVFNNYIGQVALTGLPQNQYSTLRFPLPSSTVSTLTRQLNDCSFSFAINVNATGRNWLFDNLRFTN